MSFPKKASRGSANRGRRPEPGKSAPKGRPERKERRDDGDRSSARKEPSRGGVSRGPRFQRDDRKGSEKSGGPKGRGRPEREGGQDRRGEERPTSPRPMRRGEERPTSPRPMRRGDERPTSPRPMRRGEERPTSPRPMRRGDERPTSPRPMRRGDERPTSPRPMRPSGERFTSSKSTKGAGEPGPRFAKAALSTRFETETEKSRKPERPERARPEPTKFIPHEFYIWGRRTVESYLAELSSRGGLGDHDKSHQLHIIVDKAGKAPAQLRTIVELAKSLGIALRSHSSQDEGWPLGVEEDLNHQRVCLKVPEIKTHSIEDACADMRAAIEAGVKGVVGFVLDQIQEPRNFGAILRSGAFFGVKFAVFAKDRQALITPYVLKSSAGGAFQLRLVEVVNVSRSLQSLKDAGAWIVGMTLTDAVSLSEVPCDRPYIVVLGNEGRGLRPEVLRHCDYKAKIEGGASAVESLNVSVAAGVVFHALASKG